jgi:release factor glutamine methyltransferase
MPPLIDALRSAEAILRDAGIETARLDAELLLADSIGCGRMDIHGNRAAEIQSREREKFLRAVARRSKREPLQYIVGDVQFHGLSLRVDRRVLIPRHETEELVSLLISKFSAAEIHSILDLGTGSGAIALALAKNFPGAEILAVDESHDAIEVAEENAQRNGIENVTFAPSNWFGSVSGKFDLIVANPPYLSADEFEAAQDEIKSFEPRGALVAEMDGLSDIFEIVGGTPQFLHDHGILAMETGESQHAAISKFAAACFKNFESLRDLAGRNRFIFLRK